MRAHCQCLEKYNHQGWYGECFAQVLAAAGLQCTKLTPDCTGVDFEIAYPGSEDDVRYPEIKVQVKSWSRPHVSAKDPSSWAYSGLTEKRFNALAGGHRVPRFLFLVVVPDDSSRYALASPKELVLSHAAYWVSLADKARIAGPSCKKKHPVLVPKVNLLTVDSLVSLLRSSPVRTSP